ncbi:MAG: type IV toxin-antitoxin system AbiEi family antitoxin domain-containing protein [Albidovulum sp.]|nr:type IV toxin-antitoxin system AbiEi family antitoxin domain-containing protein [Albidovulum sp.]
MRDFDAVRTLEELAQSGQTVFTLADLRGMLTRDEEKTLSGSLRRLVRYGLLERAANGVYVNPRSSRGCENLLEELARALRRGAFSFVSLECALSEWGVISQIPQGHLTVMTTGRRGVFQTPFGTIEFTHTQRRVPEIRAGTVDVGRPLRLATAKAALRDLRRVGRNLHLVRMEDYEDILEELADAGDGK